MVQVSYNKQKLTASIRAEIGGVCKATSALLREEPQATESSSRHTCVTDARASLTPATWDDYTLTFWDQQLKVLQMLAFLGALLSLFLFQCLK